MGWIENMIDCDALLKMCKSSCWHWKFNQMYLNTVSLDKPVTVTFSWKLEINRGPYTAKERKINHENILCFVSLNTSSRISRLRTYKNFKCVYSYIRDRLKRLETSISSNCTARCTHFSLSKHNIFICRLREVQSREEKSL